MSHADESYDPIVERDALLRIVARRPKSAKAWYNLGLAYKYLRAWRESADANLRAIELRSKRGDPAWWNLGIAATALRDWALARRAWRGFGIDDENLRDGAGPIELNWGITPVRLIDENGEPLEVVWGRRLCPARVRLENVPFPTSGHRWGDVVLHDGATNGERVSQGRTYFVFDELERWSPSEIPTLRADVRCANDRDALELVEAFREASFAAEDWTTSVRALCKACSKGQPDQHNHSFPKGGDERMFGIAAPPGLASQVLRTWRDASPTTRDFEEPESAA